MDKDPELREMAFGMAEHLCDALKTSLKESRKMKDGTTIDYDKTPGHIIGELQDIVRFL